MCARQRGERGRQRERERISVFNVSESESHLETLNVMLGGRRPARESSPPCEGHGVRPVDKSEKCHGPPLCYHNIWH